MLYGCKGISIGYFSQPVEELLKKVFVGYEEGERIEPAYNNKDDVEEGRDTVRLWLRIKRGGHVSLNPSARERVAWFQVFGDGVVTVDIYKEGVK